MLRAAPRPGWTGRTRGFAAPPSGEHRQRQRQRQPRAPLDDLVHGPWLEGQPVRAEPPGQQLPRLGGAEQLHADRPGTAHTNAVGQGDSGGPVEIVNPANTLQVWATGTNTAIDDTNTATACTGYVPTGRVCAWRLYDEDIFSGMAGVGASGVVLG
ncbi:hypothetical protein ACLQ24_06625 [Micromonospora sp. DT4]|uniref:hypothetical protein n=1 Tax=Micromonospora sp. DT4 TaxID=3393438 RepID=UPI003CF8DE56